MVGRASSTCGEGTWSVLNALMVLAAVLALAACSRHAEPRWLVRALPGSYPEIVYFVPTALCAIGLTIDDGPDPDTTPAILDALARHGATATFFLLGDSVAGNESLVRRMLSDGHELGHHMTEDEVTVRLSDAELERKFLSAADVLEGFGPVQWFRAGSARYDDRVLALTRSRGYRIAMASVFPVDTLIDEPARVANFDAAMVQPGSIIVLHDRGERGQRTVQTLDLLLPRLAARGYQVSSIGALEAASRADPQAPPACD